MSAHVAPFEKVEGVYRHFRNGQKYLVLNEAVWSEAARSFKEDDLVFIYPTRQEERTLLATDKDSFAVVLPPACYVGTPKVVTCGERLVVYVGLYDNPHGNRPCIRPVLEWTEMVEGRCMDAAGEGYNAKVPRFMRLT